MGQHDQTSSFVKTGLYGVVQIHSPLGKSFLLIERNYMIPVRDLGARKPGGARGKFLKGKEVISMAADLESEAFLEAGDQVLKVISDAGMLILLGPCPQQRQPDILGWECHQGSKTQPLAELGLIPHVGTQGHWCIWARVIGLLCTAGYLNKVQEKEAMSEQRTIRMYMAVGVLESWRSTSDGQSGSLDRCTTKRGTVPKLRRSEARGPRVGGPVQRPA